MGNENNKKDTYVHDKSIYNLGKHDFIGVYPLTNGKIYCHGVVGNINVKFEVRNREEIGKKIIAHTTKGKKKLLSQISELERIANSLEEKGLEGTDKFYSALNKQNNS